MSEKDEDDDKPKGKKSIVQSVKVCPNCGSRKVVRDYERGELVCSDCGLIIVEKIMDTVRNGEVGYRSTVSKACTGSPLKYIRPDKGLTTEIDLYNRDIRGLRLG